MTMTMNKKDLGRLIDTMDDPDWAPQGSVTVEIRDDRTGKIKDLETKPNFISKTWKVWARARLRAQWMAFSPNYQFTGDALNTYSLTWPIGRNSLPTMPDTHIACWNQTSAESPSTEHTPVIPATGLIAWASRHPIGGPSGSRGGINTSESMTTDLLVRNVFDWSTSQGNGVFQSVGWIGMGNPGSFRAGWGIQSRRTFTATAVASSTIIGTSTQVYSGGGYVDTATNKYYFPMKDISSAKVRICSVDASGMAASNMNTLGTAAGVTGLTITNETAEFSPTGMIAGAEFSSLRVVGKSGSLWVLTYPLSASVYASQRWCTVNAAGTFTAYYPGPTAGASNGFLCGTVIGTSVYLGCSNETAGNMIHQHTISTGAFVASFSADAALVNQVAMLQGMTGAGANARPYTMTTDGTDLYVAYAVSASETSSRGAIFRISTAGVTLQCIGTSPTGGPIPTEATAAPYAGTYSYVQNAFVGPAWDTLMGNYNDGVKDLLNIGSQNTGDLTIVPSGRFFGTYSNQALVWIDGALHVFAAPPAYYTSSVPYSFAGYRVGYDLGSRVLLGSSKSKTTADFMKITYDIVIPGWF